MTIEKAATSRAHVHGVVKRRRASVRVRWVMRFAGWGLADVEWRDRDGRVTDHVRIAGSCVGSADAKKWARKAKAGEPLPSWIKAYARAW